MSKQFVVILGLIFIFISPSVFAQSALYHTSSNVGMAVTDFGAFAAISGGNLTYNFRYPASEKDSVSYLHPYSEIWIGDTKGNVATGFDYDISQDKFVLGDFQVTQDGKLRYVYDSEGRQTIVTQYATIPENGLPFDLLIDQLSYSWKKADYPDAADFIVMKLVVTNMKSLDLKDIYIAISTNWDIDYFDNNNPNLDWADWDENRRAGFMYDADASDGLDSVHTAVVLLSGKFHSYRILPFNPNQYIDSNRSKIMLPVKIDRKSDLASPGDYMTIMVAGPYNIPRSKSIKTSFAFVAGDGLDGLRKNIDEAYRITYAPDRLTVKPKDGAVELEWSQPINPSVAGYYIMRRTEQSEYKRVNSSIVSGLIYEDKDLENGVKYYYKVIPVNLYGEEFVINGTTMESIEKSAIPNPIPPPPQLEATVSDGKIKLTWANSTDKNIVHYILFRNHTGKPPWAKIAVVDSTLTSFVDENVYSGIDYYYTIAAINLSEVQSELAQPVYIKLEEEGTELFLPKKDLEAVFAAPNPCNLSAGDNGIVFMNLTKRAKIEIYTASGELVKTVYHRNEQSTEQWDCKNEQGNLISPGTYVYYITAWTSGKNGELIKSGKFSILR